MGREILMINDDHLYVSEYKKSLAAPEITVLHAFHIHDASKIIARHRLSLVVLQLAREETETYFEFLTDIRAARPMPILVSGTVDTEERKRAYRLGADLCLDAPAFVEELIEATRAQFRRYYELNRIAQLREVDMAIRRKALMIDPQRRSVTMHGRPVYLSAKEFEVLYFLACNPGVVLSKERIYEHVWEEERHYGSLSVADHISAIRKKLGLSPMDKEYIETIYHVGYRFVE